MAKVSIIVPNYQHEAFLAQRLDSILHQRYRDYEVLLLDDGSSDDSARILSQYAAQYDNWTFEPNTENSGSPFKQWHKGINQATGEYIWIAESDDWAHPNLLQTLVGLLEEHPNAGIAYAQSILVDEEGKELNSYEENLRFIYKTNAWQEDFVKDGKAACKEWLFFHNPIPNASGALFRKEALIAAGGPDLDMRLNGDWHLYAKILMQSDLAFSPQNLNFFRVHQKTQRSKSIKRASVYRELIAINQLLRDGLPEATVEANKAMDEFANWWIGNLPYHSWNAENRALNRQLYREFSAYKNNLPWRIFLTFIISYFRDFLRWIGLLKPLKKLRAFLFPGKYWNQ